jgi:hypothetical protein
MELIRGYVAFYPDTVEVVEEADGAGPDAIRDAIEHTDSGSGAPQLARWPADDGSHG